MIEAVTIGVAIGLIVVGTVVAWRWRKHGPK